MKLAIHGEIDSTETLRIELNGEQKTLDFAHDCAVFEVPNKGIYSIGIEQQRAESHLSLRHILFFLCTAVIRGVLNILLFASDSDWYNNIRAYCIVAKLCVDIREDTDITIRLKYDKPKKYPWAIPAFSVAPKGIAQIDYIRNPNDFQNQYINYVERILSVVLVSVILFAFLLIISIKQLNAPAIVILSALIAGSLGVAIFVPINQHKKMKEIYERFLKQNECTSAQR